MDFSFSGLVIVAAVALAAPIVIGLVPGLRLPSAVLEIVAGIVVGPAVFGWVEMDDVIRVFALFGLAFLLFLAGLEIEVDRLRGRPLRLASAGFLVSFAIALVVDGALAAAGQVEDGLIVAIILSATSSGSWCPCSRTPARPAALRAAGDRGRLDRRLRQHHRPDAVLLAGGDGDRDQAAPPRGLRGGDGRRDRRPARPGALAPAVGDARPAAGHDGPGPRPRRLPPARGLRPRWPSNWASRSSWVPSRPG